MNASNGSGSMLGALAERMELQLTRFERNGEDAQALIDTSIMLAWSGSLERARRAYRVLQHNRSKIRARLRPGLAELAMAVGDREAGERELSAMKNSTRTVTMIRMLPYELEEIMESDTKDMVKIQDAERVAGRVLERIAQESERGDRQARRMAEEHLGLFNQQLSMTVARCPGTLPMVEKVTSAVLEGMQRAA